MNMAVVERSVDFLPKRQTIKIKPHLLALSRKIAGVELERILPFARGYQCLAGHLSILTQEGVRCLLETSSILNAECPQVSDIDSITKELPQVSDPKLDLYIDPYTPEKDPKAFSVFRSFFNNRESISVLEISRGCYHDCLMCAPRKKQDDSKKVIHMPYPLFLKALAQLTSGYSVFSSLNSGKFNSEKILRLHDFGDPFLWRDKSFSADFGDLALKLDEAGFVAPLISTHGRLKKDVFSKDALEKYGSSHPGRSNLSVHLFNKNIFPNSYDPPNTFLLSREAFRIKRDIEALLPSGIDFITNDESHSNPFLRKSFLLDFYERRVVALLSSDELKDRYSYHGGKTIFRILPVISAGAAVRNNGYFVPSSSSSFEFQGLCYAKADVFGNLSVLYQFNSSLTESFLLQKMYDFEEMGRFS